MGGWEWDGEGRGEEYLGRTKREGGRGEERTCMCVAEAFAHEARNVAVAGNGCVWGGGGSDAMGNVGAGWHKVVWGWHMGW